MNDILGLEKYILDKLSMDSTAVYVVDLESGEYETLKLLETTNANTMLKEGQSSYRHFNDYTDRYAEIYVPEEYHQKFKNWFSIEYLREQLKKKERVTFHYQSIPNAEGQKYFEVQAVNLYNREESGKPIALIGLRYIDDIIEREKKIQKRIQKALDEAELKNEIISAIGKSYLYISRIDLEADYYEVVSGYENIPENVKKEGRFSQNTRGNCGGMVDSAYLEQLVAFLDISTLPERLQNEESIAMEYRMQNGEWRKARLLVKKRNEEGRVTHVLCAVRTISEEKRRERQLALKAAEAKREVREKTQFLANMSHDIRTPMNGIVGLINIADQYPEDLEIQRKCRNKIRELSGYLVNIVNDILDINKLQSDDFVIQEMPFDIDELLKAANEESRRRAEKKDIKYVIDWEKGIVNHRYLVGSPIYVARILTIMADNAIKFSNPGSVISVWCSEKMTDDGKVIYTFFCKDQGIGMSREFAEHAFDLFSQEDESSRSNYKGTGLGLPIAKKLTERLHGSIRLESEKGVGTTAILELPFEIGDPDDIQAAEKSKNVSLQGLRILVAEDNELNMEIAKFILEAQGVIVECAGNGREAVWMFEESEPGYYDVILMDIMMPELNGLDATRKIRALPREDAEEIPIIAMSANALADDVIKSRLAGMNEHLTKPLDGKKIIEAIQKCI